MAVAIKELGYKNIKIYNGGLKDWKKSGYEVEVIEALPECEEKYITAEELLEMIEKADSCDCLQQNKPLLTILDYRVEKVNKEPEVKSIATNCRTIISNFDDFLNEKARQRIPREGLVVLLCETGNRDPYAIRFLRKYGYTNVVGLRFGMRGWIKNGFPTR